MMSFFKLFDPKPLKHIIKVLKSLKKFKRLAHRAPGWAGWAGLARSGWGGPLSERVSGLIF